MAILVILGKYRSWDIFCAGVPTAFAEGKLAGPPEQQVARFVHGRMGALVFILSFIFAFSILDF